MASALKNLGIVKVLLSPAMGSINLILTILNVN